MELNQERIEAAIVSEVSDRIIGEDELFDRVRTAVDTRISTLFKERADAQIREAIDAAIASGFDREYTRVNSWGERQGVPTTIRKELEKVISTYWNERVTAKGEPSQYNATQTRAEYVMSKIVAADFDAQMKQHVVNAAGQFKDGLRRSLHETVNELLSTVFKVKSLDDQTMIRTGDACIQPEAK